MPVPTKKALGKPKAASDNFELAMPDDGAPVPQGKHEAKVIDVQHSVAKGSGNKMWVWTYLITKGDAAGEELTNYTALSPAALWKVAETFRALGLAKKPGQKVTFSRKDVLGMLVILDVIEEPYEGRATSKINKVLPHPKGAGYKKVADLDEEGDEEELDEEEVEEEDLDEDEDVEEEEEGAEEEEEEEDDEDDGEELLDDDDDDDDEPDEGDEDDEEEEEEEEEEEDDEPAPPSKKAAAKKAASVAKAPVKKAPAKKR